MRRFATMCSSKWMGRRTTIVVACGALLSCNVILGMGDLDLAKDATDAGGFDWDFDVQAPPQDAGGSTPDVDSGTGVDSGKDAANATRRRVFVTSTRYPPNFGDVGAGSAICQSAATKAGLDGTWTAWLSSNGKKAIDALNFDGRYELLDGTLIVAGKAKLLGGSLAASINVMENGQKATESMEVWTGTRADGGVSDTCSNWTDATGGDLVTGVKLGTMGSANQSDGRWTDNGGQPLVSSTGWRCNQTGRLYCFEK